jgi:hypothetical protein
MVRAGALAVLAVIAQPPLVPEGTHRPAPARETICGITASSVAQFRAKVEAAGLRRQEVGPRFDAFIAETDEHLIQWTFTKPADPAHPAATCRHVYKGADGAWRSARAMRCEAGRSACDTLFLQFRQLDEQARQALQQAR